MKATGDYGASIHYKNPNEDHNYPDPSEFESSDEQEIEEYPLCYVEETEQDDEK